MLGILCLILAASPTKYVSTQWFLFVIIIAIVVTVIWCFVYFLSVREAISFPINWPLTVGDRKHVLLQYSIITFSLLYELHVRFISQEMLNMIFMAIIVAIATIFQLSHWIGARHLNDFVRNVVAGVSSSYIFLSYVCEPLARNFT